MERIFSYKTVDMLVGSLVVCENFKKTETEILAYRPSWADPMIPDLQTQINNAIRERLGMDPRAAQKLATIEIKTIMNDASAKLSNFKVQLSVDFADNKPRLNWILNTLGFTQFFKELGRKDQETLVQFLARYATGMTPALKIEIDNKGMTPGLIDEIIDSATVATNADVFQESMKEDSKINFEESIVEYNEIYTKIIGICKVLHNLFKDDKVKAQLFSFSHIINKMNHNTKPDTPDTDIPDPDPEDES